MNSRLRLTYVTGLDGWGDGEPSLEDQESFCLLVEARLQALYPNHVVEAHVESDALESRVETDDEDIDEHELRSWIGTVVWDDWCGGEHQSQAHQPTREDGP